MANLDFYGVFDYLLEDDDTYKYTASEFVKIYQSMTTNGVVKESGNEMEVTLNGLDVSVNTGSAFVNGRYGEINSAKALTLTSTGAAHIDRVILKLDIIGRVITVEIKQGTSTPPSLTQNDNIFEISLARIAVPATGVSTVLTDEREFFYKPTQLAEMVKRILEGTDHVYAVYA